MNLPPLQIAPLMPQHIEACAQLMAETPLWQAYEVTQGGAQQQFERGLQDTLSTLCVALEGERVLGFIWYCVRGTFYSGGYIRLVGVSASAQGRGVGQRLMSHAEQDIAQHSPHVFLLSSDFNTGAHGFYQRLGYVQVGALPSFAKPAFTELIFWKRV